MPDKREISLGKAWLLRQMLLELAQRVDMVERTVGGVCGIMGLELQHIIRSTADVSGALLFAQENMSASAIQFRAASCSVWNEALTLNVDVSVVSYDTDGNCHLSDGRVLKSRVADSKQAQRH